MQLWVVEHFFLHKKVPVLMIHNIVYNIKIVCYDSLLHVPFCEEKSVQLFRVAFFEVTSYKIHTLVVLDLHSRKNLTRPKKRILITCLYWASIWWQQYPGKPCWDHTLDEEWRHQFPMFDFHLLLKLENNCLQSTKSCHQAFEIKDCFGNNSQTIEFCFSLIIGQVF